MTDEDVEEQGRGNKKKNPGKGRGPPRNPPGFKGRPAGDIPMDRPGNVPDHVEEKFESQPDRKGQGSLGMQVIDSDGRVKEYKEYTRISGEGSVELFARKSRTEDGIKWLKTRRDKLPDEAQGRKDK